jgi:hypothetical protein
MISDRQQALAKINHVLSLDELMIQRNQAINDYSLNIHGENYFRDIFNRVFNRRYVNANLEKDNAPYVDLVDHREKEFVQITTTRTKEKILNTLKILESEEYKGYTVYIYYLLEKSSPKTSTIKEIKDEFGIDISDSLKNSQDLYKSIANLTDENLLKLANEVFSEHAVSYTYKVVLDLVVKRFLKDMSSVSPSYDDSLVSIETGSKIKLNKLNDRVSLCLHNALDYVFILQDLDEGELSSDLRILVVDDFYRRQLISYLKASFPSAKLKLASIEELHEMAQEKLVNFDKLIFKLAESIALSLHVKDFNAMQIGWVIVAHYFELCDVGVKK